MEEKYKIHSFYIVLILLSIIITLLSVKWAKIPYLVDYITFALTLSSLLLAVLAIIYSMISNNTFSNLISKLNTSAEYLQESSKKVSTGYDMILEKVREIPSSIESVKTSVHSTHDLIKKATTDSFKNTMTEHDSEISNSSRDIERLLETTTVRGLETIYLLNQSYIKKSEFNWIEFGELKDFKDSIQYMQGYFYALSGMGVVKYESEDAAPSSIKITKIDEYIENNIERIAKQRLEKDSREFMEEIYEEEGPENTKLIEQKVSEWVNSLRVIEDFIRFGKEKANETSMA